MLSPSALFRVNTEKHPSDAGLDPSRLLRVTGDQVARGTALRPDQAWIDECAGGMIH